MSVMWLLPLVLMLPVFALACVVLYFAGRIGWDVLKSFKH